MGLRQTRSEADLTIGLRYRRRERASNPLGEWRDSAAPCWCSFRKSNSELPHQATIAITLLKEPLSPERFAGDPVQHKSVYLRANWFHEVQGQAVTSRCVNMKHAKTGIKPESGSRKSSFGLKQGVEVIQDRVDGIDGEPRRSRQRRYASAEAAPMIGHTAKIVSWEIDRERAPRGPVSCCSL